MNEKSYEIILSELAEALENKNCTIITQRWEIDSLTARLKEAEAEIAELKKA